MTEAKQPTKKQLKEFWEWCGFTQNKQNLGRGSEYLWNYPDAQIGTLPPIDLNNLFKYAVPKALNVKRFPALSVEFTWDDAEDNLYCRVSPNYWDDTYKDPALALFWALWQVKVNND